MTRAPDTMQKLLQIGTSRAAPPSGAAAGQQFEEDLPAPLRESLLAAQVPGAAFEERLWLGMAALDLWRRAGYVPAADAAPADAPAPDAACPDEQLAPCPPRAEATLALLLQGVFPELQGQWLQLLAHHQAHLPPRFLPNLLELGTRQPALRGAIQAGLGQRGQWLARRNRDWDWAIEKAGGDAGDLAESWQTGTLDQRRAALAAWRASDPAAALQALRAGWASEPPEQRAALLPCLATKISLDDQAFLETALDDKRKEVRRVARDLLARLPGSALAQRMLARAAPLLRLQRPLFGAPRLEVTLPAERDKAMLRDGVGANYYPSLGEKASWLAELLAGVDPEHWSRAFELPPRACLALADGHDFSQALLRGWAGATARRLALSDGNTDTAEWFDALVEHWLATTPDARQYYPDDFFEAWAALPPPAAQAILARLVDAGGPPWNGQALVRIPLLRAFAHQSPQAWPAALSLALLERLFQALPAMAAQQWTYQAILPTFALVLDAAAVVAFEDGWRGLEPAARVWQTQVDKFFSAARFRHQMCLSFSEQP